MGFMDTANVSKRLREGWEFLRADTLKSEIGENEYPRIHRRQIRWFNWGWRPCVGKDTGRDSKIAR